MPPHEADAAIAEETLLRAWDALESPAPADLMTGSADAPWPPDPLEEPLADERSVECIAVAAAVICEAMTATDADAAAATDEASEIRDAT